MGRALAAAATRPCWPPRAATRRRPDRSVARDGRPEHLRAAARPRCAASASTTSTCTTCTASTPRAARGDAGARWPSCATAGHGARHRPVRGHPRRAGAGPRHPPRGRPAVGAVACGRATPSRAARSPGVRSTAPRSSPSRPLGRGFLTGTVRAGSFGDDDFAQLQPALHAGGHGRQPGLVDRVLAVADRPRRAAGPGRAGLGAGAGRAACCPIPGTRRAARLEENAAAAGLVLDAATLAELDALPPAVGDRYPGRGAAERLTPWSRSCSEAAASPSRSSCASRATAPPVSSARARTSGWPPGAPRSTPRWPAARRSTAPAAGSARGPARRRPSARPAASGPCCSRRSAGRRAGAAGRGRPRRALRAPGGAGAGTAGASPRVAEALAALLREGRTRRCPSIGSVGVSDLLLLAHAALPLVDDVELAPKDALCADRHQRRWPSAGRRCS